MKGKHFVKNRKLEKKVEENILDIIVCKHGDYCFKLKTLPKAHCSGDYMKVCGQVKKFYDRYGEKGNELGIGG